MKTLFKGLTAVMSILIGIYGIFVIVGDINLSIGLLTLSFGVLAIIWTIIARKSLSPGSQLKEFTTIFLICLISLVIYTIWENLEHHLNWEGLIIYPKYLLVSISYLTFVFAAYKMLMLSKEFGFLDKSDNISKIIEERKTRRDKLKKKK